MHKGAGSGMAKRAGVGAQARAWGKDKGYGDGRGAWGGKAAGKRSGRACSAVSYDEFESAEDEDADADEDGEEEVVGKGAGAEAEAGEDEMLLEHLDVETQSWFDVTASQVKGSKALVTFDGFEDDGGGGDSLKGTWVDAGTWHVVVAPEGLRV